MRTSVSQEAMTKVVEEKIRDKRQQEGEQITGALRTVISCPTAGAQSE